jgi:hypothetical protein
MEDRPALTLYFAKLSVLKIETASAFFAFNDRHGNNIPQKDLSQASMRNVALVMFTPHNPKQPTNFGKSHPYHGWHIL